MERSIQQTAEPPLLLLDDRTLAAAVVSVILREIL